jgi:hypothetical protein
MDKDKFDVELVITQLGRILKEYTSNKDVPFDDFYVVLDEFCVVFKMLNTFLGIAFSDVKEKVEIIKNNNLRF